MIHCAFCDATVSDVPAAIDAGWYPSYFAGDEEIADPVCPHCIGVYVRFGEGDELELIEGEDSSPYDSEIDADDGMSPQEVADEHFYRFAPRD